MSKPKFPRRNFLKQAAGLVGAAVHIDTLPGFAKQQPEDKQNSPGLPHTICYPRIFRGEQLKMIAFPLGGVGAGSLSLGGRGQLRDWEIFNRPNKGFSPPYAFPAIWAKAGNREPIARVLESQILPPYEGSSGLGSENVPGLSRLAKARFTGEYPLAHVDFEDDDFPVVVALDAFSPFIPHNPDDSGLPVAILRYNVRNPHISPANVSICFSIENPVRAASNGDPAKDTRENGYCVSGNLEGLQMSNPDLPPDEPMRGTFALAGVVEPGTRMTHWSGWPKGRWWDSAMMFWDAFSETGQLNSKLQASGKVGALCQQRSILPGQSASFTFILAWHFPTRTPEWSGWTAPPQMGKANLGNFYATRFHDAWAAAEYAAKNLISLEGQTRVFAKAFRDSTLPAAVKEAASANLSTLASTTCFRTADGEFHGFEGSNDTSGCCPGNCLHVWNYEVTTSFLFPTFARSLRKSALGYSMDDAGGMHFRQLLPDGQARSGVVAADGQMGQVVHAYMDWKLSGELEWLRGIWPRIRKAIEFAWIPGGWDANRDGVMEGVQHNTYDVEFFGPNPMCTLHYLGALRAGEEMAKALNENATAASYRKLFDHGSAWVDANLFNGRFYTQQVTPYRAEQIAPFLISGYGSEDAGHPQYQVGDGCLADQLIGQYLADVAGLGPLVSAENVRSTLTYIFEKNYRRSLVGHQNVERTYVLNDEAAILICEYGKNSRPKTPFPYYAEAWTGVEHSVAALMLFSGMVDEGVECIHNVRSRYDGVKRNPWDEAECGHHYARAMAAWASIVALSGFRSDGSGAITVIPRIPHQVFQCFWSTGKGWGSFSFGRAAKGGRVFGIKVLAGSLSSRSCELAGSAANAVTKLDGIVQRNTVECSRGRMLIHFDSELEIVQHSELQVAYRD